MGDRVIKVTETKYQVTQSAQRGSQGIQGIPGEVTKNQLTYRSFIKDCGAIPDGVTDNKAAIAIAKTLSDQGHVILGEYEGAGVYFVDVDGSGDYVNRAKVEGLNLQMDPRARFKMKAHPDFARLNNLILPVRIENPFGRDYTWNNKPGFSSIAAILSSPIVYDVPTNNIALLDLSSDFQTIHINLDGTYDDSTFNGTRAAALVSWASALTTGVKEGVQKSVKLGDYIEATVKRSGSVNLANVYTTVVGVRTKDGYSYRFHINNKARMFDYKGDGIAGYTGRTLNPNTKMGDFYTIADGLSEPSVNYALRIVPNNTVEFYINGVMFAKEQILSTHEIDRVFFSVEGSYADIMTISNAFSIAKYNPHSSKPLSVALIGDSITHGSRSNWDYGELLEYVAHGMNGLGKITSTNLGISGSNAHEWANGLNGVPNISTYNFSGYNYVVVMLGTNEIVKKIGAANYEADLTTIVNKIVADGAKPILCSFPVMLRPGAGVDQEYSNDWYSTTAEYISIIKKVCAAKGCKMAEPRNYIGANWDWMGDNLHFRDFGMAAIAKAVAVAISQIEKPSYINFDMLDPNLNINDLVVASAVSATGNITIPNSKNLKDYKYLQVIVTDGTNRHAEIIRTLTVSNGQIYKFDISTSTADRYVYITFVSNTVMNVTGLVGGVTITEIRLFN